MEDNEIWELENVENLTEAEYLNKVLGPKYLPRNIVLPLTAVYVTIFISGIFGNVATCTVIVKNSSMQTATNYYLFSLAISDLILLILGLPNELSIFWQQYPWSLGVGLCKIRAYVSEMSSYVSVLTIVAFSMERYFAICHPLRVYAMSGLKRPLRFIVAAWSVALLVAIPFAIYTKINYVEFPPGSGNYSKDSAICAMLLPDMPNFPLYEMSCIIFFLLPMFIILVVYARMGLKIMNSTRMSVAPIFNKSVHGESRQIQSRKSTIKMLGAVVVMFFVCWAPFHAQRLLYIYGQDRDYYSDLNEWLYVLSGCLYYFSTTVNPILYNLMSVKYRDAFKRTICFKRYRSSCLHCRCCSSSTTKCTWHIRNAKLCRCDSYPDEAHTPHFICNVRHRVDRTKKFFRFSSKSNENRHDGRWKSHDSYRTTKLLIADHPTVEAKNSDESVTSSSTNKTKIRESSSTASSVL